MRRVFRFREDRRGNSPTIPDRGFFEAVRYWARMGAPWRDPPSGYNRLRCSVYPGNLATLLEHLTAAPVLGEVRRVWSG